MVDTFVLTDCHHIIGDGNDQISSYLTHDAQCAGGWGAQGGEDIIGGIGQTRGGGEVGGR